MANFNFYKKSEYKLNSQMIGEVINLYGININFIKVSQINKDENVFNDFSHLRSECIHQMMALPEESDTFEISNSSLTDFGLISYDNMNLFVHVDSFKEICSMNEIVGNIIQLPSNKYMEITNIELQVPGMNNQFTYGNSKSVVKLTCVPYEFKSVDEIKQESHEEFTSETEEDKKMDDVLYDYNALNDYFNEIVKTSDEIQKEFTQEPAIVDNSGKEVPRVDKSVDDVWGQFS